MEKNREDNTSKEFAIIGMSCRVPGADNWRTFWNNLISGKESIHFYEESELERLGVNKFELLKKNYVKAKSVVNSKESFDNLFFKYSNKEAELMNPSHRVFHENVWEALEDAGYTPSEVNGKISIYAGVGDDTNWKAYAMLKNMDEVVDEMTLNFISSKDHLASLIAYKLNLQGAAYSINTACSSSLAAIHLACRGLLMGEAKLAIAGGVSIATRKQHGYEYKEELIYSSDGHCRAFDEAADGTVGSEGSGVVVIKKLSDAIADNDHIYAIIKGSLANNDGNRKVGYAAPSIVGQAECIKETHEVSNVTPETISYIEAHGTGTKIGDPIEVEALNLAFNKNNTHDCALGSVKTNFGHTDSASGVIGLIKVALSLKYKKIPPTLHYKKANSNIYFDEGPFYVNTELKDLKNNGIPLRAGVSSFGIGGTNVHLVLEEAPEQVSKEVFRHSNKMLTLSAKTKSSLNKYLKRLETFIKEEEVNLDDLIYTYRVGRDSFDYRIALSFKDREELLSKLSENYKNLDKIQGSAKKKKIVFLFPGLGNQYKNMTKEIYEKENIFKEKIDEGCDYLKKLTGNDFKSILFSDNEKIEKQEYAEPLLFLVEYSLAYLLKSYNILPDYVLGQNIGEYVAACISGVFSLKEGLKLITLKSKLLNPKKTKVLLNALLIEEEAEKFIDNQISLAAINGTQQVTFSGKQKAIEKLSNQFDELGIMNSKVHKKYIDFSEVDEEFKKQFMSNCEELSTNKTQVPFISGINGKEFKDKEITAEYWLDLITKTNKFYSSIAKLREENKELIFIEVGPGNSIEKLLKRETVFEKSKNSIVINVTKQLENNEEIFEKALVKLWYEGVNLDWKPYYIGSNNKRISLPSYCFEQNLFPAEVEPFKEILESKVASSVEIITQSSKREIDISEPEEIDVSTKLKTILKGFFDVEEIEEDSDFIEMGINSLNGMLLLKKIKTEFEIDLTLHEFFECQSMADITDKIIKLQPTVSFENQYNTMTI
ncbi:beta-ketoacyl synthase N-terminal-like domain-containing protein [Tenacibaculum ascidiaceicola]|uniref:beta-ketoacyl synthase N-terminal-like domain-containing protein n=1 Tax=Tenacibaculum ascidiaceicola TaxID=1699411 RepID=UPI003CE5639B